MGHHLLLTLIINTQGNYSTLLKKKNFLFRPLTFDDFKRVDELSGLKIRNRDIDRHSTLHQNTHMYI